MNPPNINAEGLELEPGYRWVDVANEQPNPEAEWYNDEGWLKRTESHVTPYYQSLSYRIKVEPKPTEPESFWGMDGWESLESDIEDAVKRYVGDACETALVEMVEKAEWPAVFNEHKHAKKPDAARVLERVLENLDEDLGNPDGDATEPTPKMLAAMQTILDEYTVWNCEETGKTVTVTKEEALAMLKGGGHE